MNPAESNSFPPLAIVILKEWHLSFLCVLVSASRNALMIQSCRSLWRLSKKNPDRTWAGNPCSLGLVVLHHNLILVPCWGRNFETSVCSGSAGPPFRAPGYEAPLLRCHTMRNCLLALYILEQKRTPATGQPNFLFLLWTVSVHWTWAQGNEKLEFNML